jgi:hypothetical protein
VSAVATPIRTDVLDEGARLAGLASEMGVRLRILGGVAVYLRSEDRPSSLTRTCQDIDVAAPREQSRDVDRLFEAAGYAPHVSFNAFNRGERMLFVDEVNGRQVDVFLGTFRMCHEVVFGNRITVDDVTVPLAELLLTKLQIVEINHKDVQDVLLLVANHPVEEHDDDTINAAHLARLCAVNWGLWRTITQNLNRCHAAVDEFDLPDGTRSRIATRLATLIDRIDAEPKGRKWTLRARVGDRKRWYDLPEEVVR